MKRPKASAFENRPSPPTQSCSDASVGVFSGCLQLLSGRISNCREGRSRQALYIDMVYPSNEQTHGKTRCTKEQIRDYPPDR